MFDEHYKLVILIHIIAFYWCWKKIDGLAGLMTPVFKKKFQLVSSCKDTQRYIVNEKFSHRESGNGYRWGMCHTSTALYLYGASKKTLYKHRATFGNMLF